MRFRRWTPRLVVLVIVGLAVVAAVAWRVLARRETAVASVPTEAVQRQDVAVTIEATGTVEPVDLIEVKSKASGQILRMPVQVGSVVRAHELLAQIDTFDVQNQYDQALAALRAAQAKTDISRAQRKRADELFEKDVITADEHESATLDFANAQASLVKARTDVATAQLRRQDATVRAPSSGTVLEQLVSEGQVIASATSSASGGTALLRMADLSRIRLRALVAETDIGSVRPGQTATVSVDAFPNRPFTGAVEKIEPQAVVQQSVTMFPVLISISNERGLLLPGMNGEVSMLIAEHRDVPAVPVDAVRSARELPAVAVALGLDPDSVSARVQRQVEARRSGQRSRAAGDSAAPGASGPGLATGPGHGGTGADSARARARWAGRGGSFPDSAARARWRAGGSGARGGAGAGPAGAVSPYVGNGGGGGNGRASRTQVVFVKTARGLEPRVVLLGLTNFDYAEVLEGVKEGEEVALLSVAELQAKRTQDQNRLRERMGSGMPGVPGAGGTRGTGTRSSGGGR